MNYYTLQEINCNCGCGAKHISILLMEILNKVREEYGKPIYPNSVCRCPGYNQAVGGKEDSAHISTEEEPCEAADIRCEHSHDRFELIKLFLKYGIKRIGISFKNNFIHVDVDSKKPQEVMWGY